MWGGIFTKINLTGHIKELTSNKKTSFTTKAIKQKDKISFILNDEKYILKIIPNNRLILNRETAKINSTIYFEKNKTISSIYTIKENDITIYIDIRTDYLEISNNIIKIVYTVIDSNDCYEYNIEMSE